MKLPRTQVIALANQKGGCGKTSTAVNLSAAFASDGYRTCLIDLDGQCNASTTFGADPDEYRRSKKPTVLDAYINKRPAQQLAHQVVGEKGEVRFEGLLSVVPGHPSLAALHQQLESGLRMEALAQQLSPEEEDDQRRDHRERLYKSIESLRVDHDFVVLDTPPELGFLLSSALRAADWFIIPVFPSEYDLNGLRRLIESAKKIRERSNPGLRLLCVVVGNYDSNTLLDQQIYNRLQQRFGGLLASVRIGRGVKMREATSHHLTIFEHAADSPQAKQFSALAREVLQRLQAQPAGELKPVVLPTEAMPAPETLDMGMEAAGGAEEAAHG